MLEQKVSYQAHLQRPNRESEAREATAPSAEECQAQVTVPGSPRTLSSSLRRLRGYFRCDDFGARREGLSMCRNWAAGAWQTKDIGVRRCRTSFEEATAVSAFNPDSFPSSLPLRLPGPPRRRLPRAPPPPAAPPPFISSPSSSSPSSSPSSSSSIQKQQQLAPPAMGNYGQQRPPPPPPPPPRQPPQSQGQHQSHLASFRVIAKLLVSNSAAGAVIGRAGGAIGALQAASGARLQLSRAREYFPGTQDRVLLIAGSMESVLTALHLVLQKLAAERVSAEEFSVLFVSSSSSTCLFRRRSPGSLFPLLFFP